MIVVTGATGQLGRAVVEQLLERVPADKIAVSVRDPEKASSLTERGVSVRQGDFQDSQSLHQAFAGASKVLIISSNSSGEDAVRHHRNAVEAAQKAGAEHIFYTSHMGSNANSRFAPMRDHAATEALLQNTGVAFTSLRNGFYGASALMIMGQAFATGELIAPEDGPVSWTTHADLAEAAAIALTEESVSGLTRPLTAREALDLADLASLAAELSGREIKRIIVADEKYRETLVARGVPEPRADLMLGLFAASRRGEFAAVDPTLERLLERPPVSMREILHAHFASKL